MDRDNAAWLTYLRSDGDDRQSAVSDLRELLLRSLRKSMSNRPFTDESLLEDAVQDSLMRILGRLDQFEGRSRFLTWATSIAIHVAMSEFRRRRWKDVSLEQVIADSNFMPERAIDADSGPEIRLERKAVFEKLHELIEHQLTEKQRTALLAELKGVPLDEIARHLGSNRNAVYKLTHDARKKLKTGLEAAGFDAADISTATTG